MPPFAQSLALAWASGVSVYGTVALLEIAVRRGWIDGLPSPLSGVADTWVIALAGVLYLFEFLATSIPGVASAWETFHTLVRPVAGAALVSGTLAFGTHTSPEPFTNGAANVAELGLVATVAIVVWHHPYLALTVAVVLLLAGVLALRTLWRLLKRLVRTRR